MPRRFGPPDGWVVQGFTFAIDPTDEQLAIIARFFGARRKAYNWALEQIKAGIDAYHATGVESERPSLYGLRKRWNAEKSAICVSTETGEVWWPEVSKEVFANGIGGAVDAYWRWQGSRAGTIAGRRVGFPRYKKRGKDRDRCTFTTGAMRLEHDRRHLRLPGLGTVRTHENTRKIERLVTSGRARIVSVTLSRRGTRIVAAVKLAASRPQQPGVAEPSSVVGVDVGMRRLATVATAQQVIAVVDNPKALERRLTELRRRAPTLPPRIRLLPLPGDGKEAHPPPRSGGGGPAARDPQPHRPARQDPRRDRCREAGRGRDAATKGPPRRASAPAGALRRHPRGTAAATPLQVRLVREHIGGGRPFLSLLQDVPALWARPGHRLVGALELRGLQGGAPARRQRRHQPRPSGEPGRSWRPGEAWSRA
jgi:putative transposase